MKIATYLTGLVFLRTWIRTFLTTVWTLESRQMFFFLRKYLNIVISTKMILFSWTCKFLIVALGLVGIFEFSQEFLWLKVTKIHYQWLTVQKKIFLSVLIPTCDWHICLISLTFQTKDITIYLAEIRDSSSEKIFLKVLIYFSDQSLSAPCVYHWRCLDYDYKCYLFILSYFSKLGDFFTDNIQSLSHTLENNLIFFLSNLNPPAHVFPREFWY